VVEGAAGAGKTTTLAAAREALAAHGHRLVVVTPSLKAAQSASAEVGTRAGSAAWLAWQHGWRWDQTGAWTRTPTVPTPEAVLRRDDLLLVDEAGMLDQDTARALVTIADETGARVALVGTGTSCPRWAAAAYSTSPTAASTRTPASTWTPCTGSSTPWTVAPYPIPSTRNQLAMRAGDNPAAVFDALHARGHITVHASEVGA
jgi:ATP-dependent exoDNAse (exonuclease V) alpha subunit